MKKLIMSFFKEFKRWTGFFCHLQPLFVTFLQLDSERKRNILIMLQLWWNVEKPTLEEIPYSLEQKCPSKKLMKRWLHISNDWNMSTEKCFYEIHQIFYQHILQLRTMVHTAHQQSEHIPKSMYYEMQLSRCISIISYLDMYDNKVSVWGHFCVLGRRYPPIEGRALKDEEKKWISRCVAKMKNITFNSFFRPPRTFFREFSLKCQKWKFISKKNASYCLLAVSTLFFTCNLRVTHLSTIFHEIAEWIFCASIGNRNWCKKCSKKSAAMG